MPKEFPRIVKWWVGSKLPSYYYGYGYKGFLIHPIKRRLAKVYVSFLQKILGLKVIGITGSVGKTTAKEMIMSVLSQKYPTISSYANIDPVYNIPTTILRTPLNTKMLVLEMGVEYQGDIDFYNWIVKPDIGVLLNIYWTHTEFLGGVDGVQREKGKLITNLPSGGFAVLNNDDPRVSKFRDGTGAEVITFGVKEKSMVSAKNITITNDYKTRFTLVTNNVSLDITLPVLGKHFVYAALAAVAVGHSQSVSLEVIKKGVELFTPSPHRMFPRKTKGGALILDDTYNSNPLGAKAAIDTLVEIDKKKKKIAVLGDMLELGEYTRDGHNEVGKYAAKRVDRLVCIGEYAEYFKEGAIKGGMKMDSVNMFRDKESSFQLIKTLVKKDTVVLFKASRKLKFEELVERLAK